MDNNDILQHIEEIFAENGIELTDKGFVISSLVYITVLCQLEEKFKIQFPDEVLLNNILADIEQLTNIIKFLIDNKDTDSKKED